MFKVIGLDYQEFAHLFDLSDAGLQALGGVRRTATLDPGFPCRVSLEDAGIGEQLLLLPYEHHAVSSPYRLSGPIFVRQHALAPDLPVGALPPYVTRRLISVRGYDAAHMMVSASVVKGVDVARELERELENPDVSYIHLHNAKPGCYSCRVVRA